MESIMWMAHVNHQEELPHLLGPNTIALWWVPKTRCVPLQTYWIMKGNSTPQWMRIRWCVPSKHWEIASTVNSVINPCYLKNNWQYNNSWLLQVSRLLTRRHMSNYRCTAWRSKEWTTVWENILPDRWTSCVVLYMGNQLTTSSKISSRMSRNWAQYLALTMFNRRWQWRK